MNREEVVRFIEKQLRWDYDGNAVFPKPNTCHYGRQELLLDLLYGGPPQTAAESLLAAEDE